MTTTWPIQLICEDGSQNLGKYFIYIYPFIIMGITKDSDGQHLEEVIQAKPVGTLLHVVSNLEAS